jgi:autotransporter-associated beta strand protein
LTFEAGAGAFILSGNNAVNLGGGIANNSTSTQTIGLPLALVGGSQTVNTASGGVKLTGDIGQSGGTYGITKTGSGTLILSGTDSYTGGTTVSAGKLVLAKPSALATGTSLTVGADAASVFNASAGDTSGDMNVTTAVPNSTSAASARTVLSPARAADVSAAGGGVLPSAASATDSAGGAPVQNAMPSAPAPLPAGDGRKAGDPAWLGQAADNSDNLHPSHEKTRAMLAWEAVFAHYGR